MKRVIIRVVRFSLPSYVIEHDATFNGAPVKTVAEFMRAVV